MNNIFLKSLKNIPKFIFVIAFAGALCSSTAYRVWAANACTSVAGTINWSAPGTWINCGGTTPQPLDSVTIIINSTVTLDVDASITGLTFIGGNNSNSLVQSGTNLIMSSTVTLNQPTGIYTSSWKINNGTATVAGLLTFAGNNVTATRISKIIITSGQLKANGAMTFVASANATKVIDMSGGAGTLNLKGALTVPANSGTLTAGTAGSAFSYYDSVAQTVSTFPAGAYYNLYLNNTSATGVTIPLAITAVMVTGDMRVQSGYFRNNGFAITALGGKTFEVVNGSTFDMTGAASNFPTGYGTFTFGPTSIVHYLQNFSLTVSTQVFGNLELKPAGAGFTYTLPTSALNVNGSLTLGNGTNADTYTGLTNNAAINVISSVTIAASATFSAPNNIITVGNGWANNGTFTCNTGTVTFNGNSSGLTLSGNISGTSKFYCLIFNGINGGWSNTAALQTTLHLTITNGTLTAGNTITVGGNWANNATFTANSQTVIMAGTTLGRILSGTLTGAGAFFNLTYNGAGGSWLNNSAMEIDNDFTVTAGTASGTNNITVNGSVLGSGGAMINLTGGTFEQLVSAPKTFGTNVGGINNWTFNNLTFSNGSLSDQTITMNAGGWGQIVVSGTLTIGNAGNPNKTIIDDETNDRLITANGDFTITGQGSYLASSSQNLSVKGNWANSGSFTANSGTVTFTSVTGSKSLTGPLNGSNAFFNLTFNGIGGGWTPGSDMLVLSTLTVTAGTLSGTNNITVNGTVIGSGANGIINLTGGTFEQQVSANQFFGTTVAGASAWTFNNLTFTNASPADQTIRTSAVGNNTITVTGILTIGSDGDGHKTIIDNLTNNRIFTANGNFIITTQGSFSASSTQNLSVKGNWTNNGIFTANAGTVVFTAVTPGFTLSGTLNGISQFNNLTFNGVGGGWSASSDMLIGSTLTVTAGTLSGTHNIVVNGGVVGNGGSGTINFSVGTFEQRVVTNQLFGTSVIGANTWTFNDLIFSNSSTTVDNIITLNITGNNTITVNGTLTIGIDGDAHKTTLNDLTNNRIINANGDLTITSQGILSGCNSTNISVGGNWANSGLFTANTGTIVFDATVEGKVLSGTLNGTSKFNNITFNGTGGSWSNSSDMLVAGAFTVTVGTFSGSGNVIVNGAVTGNGATGGINLSGGTFEQQVTAAALFGTNALGPINWTFNNLIFRNLSGAAIQTITPSSLGSGQIVVNGTLTVGAADTYPIIVNDDTNDRIINANNFIINKGTYTASATVGILYIGGDYTNNGTLMAMTGTIVFDATSENKILSGTLNGSSKFNNLTFNGTGGSWSNSSDMLVGAAFTVSAGTFSGSGNVIVIGAVAGDGSKGVINMSGGTFEQRVAAASNFGTNASGINNWTFNNLLFTNTSVADRIIQMNNLGSGLIIVNGTLTIGNVAYTNKAVIDNETFDRIINANGDLTITTRGTLTASSSQILYVGGNYTNGGLFTCGTGTVIFDATSLKTLSGTLNGVSKFNNLIFDGVSGSWSNSTDMLVGADLTINHGNFSAGTTVSVAGSWTNNDTFTANGSTVTFTALAAGKSLSGTLSGVSQFNNLTFNGAGGAWSINSDLVVGSTLTVTNGAVSGAHDVTVNASVIGSGAAGTINFSNGTFKQLISDNQFFGTTVAGASGWTFNNLTFYNASAATDLAVILSAVGNNTITVNGTLTIGNDGDAHKTTLNDNTNNRIIDAKGDFTITTQGILSACNSVNISVGGNWANTGLFTANTGTIVFDATSGGKILSGNLNGTSKFNNVTFNGVNGGWSNSSDMLVGIDLTITNGTLSAGNNITVGNNWTNNGTFTANSYTVTFTAVATGKTLTGTLNGTSKFNNLTFNGFGGGWANGSAMEVGGDFTVTAGTVSGTNNITVNGAVVGDGTNGTINLTGGTFEQHVSAAETFGSNTVGTNNWTFNNLTFSNGSASADQTILINPSGIGQIIVNGTLTVGNAGDQHLTIVDDETNDRIIMANGDFTIASQGSFSASSTQSLYVKGNWANNGIFTANSGTVVFTAVALGKTLIGTLNGTSKFYNLTFNGVGGGWANNSDMLVGSTLTVAAGTLSGTKNITVNASVVGNGGTGTINLSNGTFEQRVSTYQLFGTTVAGANGWTFNNLVFSNASDSSDQYITLSAIGNNTITVNGNVTVGNGGDLHKTFVDEEINDRIIVANGDFIIATQGSFLASSTQNLPVKGNWTNSGTFTANSGTVTFTATSVGKSLSGTLDGTSKFNNLTFNGAGGGWSINSDLLVGSTFTVTNGTVSGAHDVTVNASVTGSGATGTINFSAGTFKQLISADQYFGTTVAGATGWTFNNLTFSNSSASNDRIVVLSPLGNNTITVNGTLTIGIDSDAHKTTLNDFTNNRIINANGDLTITSQGILSACNSTNISVGGNWANTGLFTANTGTIVFDATMEGKILSGILNGTSKFNNLTFSGAGGSWSNTADILVAGAFTVTVGTFSGSGNVIVNGAVLGNGGTGGINLSGGTFEQQVTAAALFGTNSLGPINWTFNNLIFRNLSGAAIQTITPSSLGSGQIVVNGTLTVGAADTYPIIVNDDTNDRIINANNFIINKGTYTASATVGILYIGGDYTNNGTLMAMTGTIVFDATSENKILSGTLNGSSKFNNLTFNGTGGSWSNSSDMLVGAAFTVSAGTFSGSGNVIVNGAVAGDGSNGVINMSGGTFEQRVALASNFGTNASGINNWTFNNLLFTNTSVADRIIQMNNLGSGLIIVNGTLTIGNVAYTNKAVIDNESFDRIINANGDLTITTRGTLTASSSQILYVGGNYVNNGLFTCGTGTVIFDATSLKTLSGTLNGVSKFNNLTFDGVSGSWSNSTDLLVGADLTINHGNFSAGNTISVAGSWTNNDTFTANTYTVTFTAIAGGKTLSGTLDGTSKFNHLTFSGAGGAWSIDSNLLVGSTFTVTNGTVSGAHDVTVNASVVGSGATGTINFSAGTFNQIISADQYFGTTVAGATGWTFNNLTFSNSSASNDRIVVLSPLGNNTITVNGTLTIGNGGDAHKTTLNDLTNNRIINANGNLTIATQGILSACNSTNISVGGDWANTGLFTANTGTIVFDATAEGKVLSGILNGTSKFNSITFSGAGGGWSNTSDMLVGVAFTVTVGTFSGSGNVIVNGAVTGNGVTGGINLIGGTFEQQVTAAQGFGTSSAGIINWTFNNLTFRNLSGAALQTITPSSLGGGQIIINGTLTVGAADTFPIVVNDETFDRYINTNNFIIGKGTYTASSTQPLYIGGNYTNNGTFTPNTGTVIFDATTENKIFSGTLNGTSKFYNVTFNGVGGGWSNINDMLVSAAFTVTNGTFSGSGNVIVNGAVTGDGGTGGINLTGGTFEHQVTAAQGFGTSSAGIINWTFNNLIFRNLSGVALQTITPSSLGGGQIIVNGTLTIGAADTFPIIVNDETFDRFINANNFTIGKGTYTASSTQPLYVGGNWTNGGTFTANAGTVIFDATSGGKILSGTLNGTSKFNNVTFNGSNGGWSNSSDLLAIGDLTVTAGTVSGTGNITVYGSVAGDGTNGFINLTGGTFEQQIGADKSFGTNTMGGNDWAFKNLTFSNSSALDRTFTTNPSGSGSIIVNGLLSVGKVADSNKSVVDNETNDRLINAHGGLTITTKGTLQASSDQILTVGGTWTNNGTFTANNSTVAFNGAGNQTIAGVTTFYGLKATTNGTILKFTQATTYSVTYMVDFERVTLHSTTDNQAWSFKYSGSSQTLINLDVKDSDASLGSLMQADITSTNNGNNFNWDFGPPGSLINFTAIPSSTGSAVDLSWTAPGDDGFLQVLNNSAFIIQYTTMPEFSSWSPTIACPDYVYRLTIPINGVNPGDSQMKTIDSLIEGATYFCRLWTKDHVGNYSDISNSTNAYTTNIALAVLVPFYSLNLGSLLPGATVVYSSSITITNSGNITSNFRISITDPPIWKSTLGGAGQDTFRLTGIFKGNTPLAADFDPANDIIETSMKTASTENFAKDTDAVTYKGINVYPNDKRGLWLRIEMPPYSTTLNDQVIRLSASSIQ